MKVYVAGARGIPDIPGGVERHCQELYPRIAAMGWDVVMATRRIYAGELREWSGVRLQPLPSTKKKGLEALFHTFLAVLAARRAKADLLHIHAIGPGLMVPLAKLLGLKVVLTNHGPDYRRAKWGRMAKVVLKLGEKLGCSMADQVIAVSEEIGRIVERRCGRAARVIPNGMPKLTPSLSDDKIREMGLEPGGYILSVARLAPEKGLWDLIRAHEKSQSPLKLVIAGDADHESDYSRSIFQRAKENPNLVAPGYVTGETLNQLYSHAKLFVLASHHEGRPIALLEALSLGVPPLVSDITAHLELELGPQSYFPVRDVKNLASKISTLTNNPGPPPNTQNLLQTHDWTKIARRTAQTYEDALASGGWGRRPQTPARGAAPGPRRGE